MLTKEKRKIFWVDTLPMILAGAGILIFSMLNKQHPVKTLPTLISLAVMLLAARANRYSYLLGAMNVLLYTVGYFMEGLVFVESQYIKAAGTLVYLVMWGAIVWTKQAKLEKQNA